MTTKYDVIKCFKTYAEMTGQGIEVRVKDSIDINNIQLDDIIAVFIDGEFRIDNATKTCDNEITKVAA